MSKANKIKKTKKKADKTLIVIIVTIIALFICFIGVLILPEPITAYVRRSECKNFIENTDTPTVAISSPLQSGDEVLINAEEILRDENAKEFSNRLLSVMKNTKYKSTNSVNLGIWKTKITVYNSNDKYSIYIDKNGLYLESRGKIIQYEVKNDAELEALNSEINMYLESKK